MNIFKEFKGETIAVNFDYRGANVEIIALADRTKTQIIVNEFLCEEIEGASQAILNMAENIAKRKIDSVLDDAKNNELEK